MSLTLRTLLEQRELGLELVAGADGCLSRPVVGAHSIEISDPVRFLKPNWVMLSNGVRLRNHPDEQRKLIAEIDRGGISALGFGLGEFFQRIPTALLEEALERDFPMFVIRGPTPFREIISFVNQATLSQNVARLRRAMAIQADLIDDLVKSQPEQAVIERLATTLGCDAVLISARGTAEAIVGAPHPTRSGPRSSAGGGRCASSRSKVGT